MASSNDFDLPAEIIEKILSYLPDQSIVVASKVCRMWFDISERIAMKRCENVCIHEVKGQCSADDSLWLKVLTWNALSELLVSERATKSVLSASLPQKFGIICDKGYAVDDRCLIVSETRTRFIEVYDMKTQNKVPNKTVQCESGLILQIHTVPCLKILLVLTTENLDVYKLPDFDISDEMKKLDYVVESCESLNQSLSFVDFSIDGPNLAAKVDDTHIIIFKLERKHDGVISFQYITQYEMLASVFTFSLWDGRLTALLETGIVERWSSTGMHASEPYQEIRYRNPVWIYRDDVYCTTLLSQELLAYWHLESGTAYWLVGDPCVDELMRYDTTVIYSYANEEETRTDVVCCVYRKHYLLFCGTDMGNLIVFRASDNFTHGTALFVAKIAAEKIDDLKVDFGEDCIYIAVRSRANISRTVIQFT